MTSIVGDILNSIDIDESSSITNMSQSRAQQIKSNTNTKKSLVQNAKYTELVNEFESWYNYLSTPSNAAKTEITVDAAVFKKKMSTLTPSKIKEFENYVIEKYGENFVTKFDEVQSIISVTDTELYTEFAKSYNYGQQVTDVILSSMNSYIARLQEAHSIQGEFNTATITVIKNSIVKLNNLID